MAERLEVLEAFFTATQADTRHGGNKAVYSPSSDFQSIPRTLTINNVRNVLEIPQNSFPSVPNNFTHYSHDQYIIQPKRATVRAI